jgi:hypothetical protein
LDRPVVQPLDVDGRPKDAAIDLGAIAPEQLAIVRPVATSTG